MFVSSGMTSEGGAFRGRDLVLLKEIPHLVLLRTVYKGDIREALCAINVANMVRIASAILPNPMEREIVSLVETINFDLLV